MNATQVQRPPCEWSGLLCSRGSTPAISSAKYSARYDFNRHSPLLPWVRSGVSRCILAARLGQTFATVHLEKTRHRFCSSGSGKLPRCIFSGSIAQDLISIIRHPPCLSHNPVPIGFIQLQFPTQNTMYYDIPSFHLFVLVFLSTAFVAQRMYTTYRLIRRLASV
jgi:hypothetical protein